MWPLVFYSIFGIVHSMTNWCEVMDFEGTQDFMWTSFHMQGTMMMVAAYPSNKPDGADEWRFVDTNQKYEPNKWQTEKKVPKFHGKPDVNPYSRRVLYNEEYAAIAAIRPFGNKNKDFDAEQLIIDNIGLIRSGHDEKKALFILSTLTPARTHTDERYLSRLCHGFKYCYFLFRRLHICSPPNWVDALPVNRWRVIQCNGLNEQTIIQGKDRNGQIIRHKVKGSPLRPGSPIRTGSPLRPDSLPQGGSVEYCDNFYIEDAAMDENIFVYSGAILISMFIASLFILSMCIGIVFGYNRKSESDKNDLICKL